MSISASPPDSLARLDKAALVTYLEEGCKPRESWRIGTEHEKIGFKIPDYSPLPYDPSDGIGIRTLLERLHRALNWDPIVENGSIIGLREAKAGGAAITLEPGGQFELSGGLMENLHQSCHEVENHLKVVADISEAMGIGFLGIGYSPLWERGEAPIMPKRRYEIMANYMPKRGRLGLDMMFCSCTVQVNLDYASEADMVRKYRVGLALQPLVTALFANSPFSGGHPNGYRSWRSAIWLDTDNDRTGMVPFVFEDGMGFERYVDYALDVPMYFIYRDGKYHDVSGYSFRDFMSGELSDFPKLRPTLTDWENHLTTLFPEVRLKKFIEMRGADSGLWRQLCALPALWVGLLYDTTALDAAWDLVRDWSAEDRQAMRESVPISGLATKLPPLRGGSSLTLGDLAREVLVIAREGLENRGYVDAFGEDETLFLAALEDIVSRGRSSADDLLELYHGSWEGDIMPIFTAYAY